MLKAKLLRLNKEYGRVEIEINYSDNTQSFNKTYRFDSITKEGVKELARREITRFDKNKQEILDLVVNQDIDLTKPLPLVKIPPTQVELDHKTWFENWNKLTSLISLANHGLIAKTDTRISNLQTSLIANWKSSYLGDI